MNFVFLVIHPVFQEVVLECTRLANFGVINRVFFSKYKLLYSKKGQIAQITNQYINK